MILKTNGGYEGALGTSTGMTDSIGNDLFVGDEVIAFVRNDYDRNIASMGEEYGVHFVCEEDHSKTKWTFNEGFYVMGIASVWNNFDGKFKEKFDIRQKYLEDNNIEISEDEKYNSRWEIHKIKDWSKVVVNECWDNIFATQE